MLQARAYMMLGACSKMVQPIHELLPRVFCKQSVSSEPLHVRDQLVVALRSSADEVVLLVHGILHRVVPSGEWAAVGLGLAHTGDRCLADRLPTALHHAKLLRHVLRPKLEAGAVAREELAKLELSQFELLQA